MTDVFRGENVTSKVPLISLEVKMREVRYD